MVLKNNIEIAMSYHNGKILVGPMNNSINCLIKICPGNSIIKEHTIHFSSLMIHKLRYTIIKRISIIYEFLLVINYTGTLLIRLLV